MKTIIQKPIFDIFSKKEKAAKKGTEPKPKIIIDYREKNSLVASHLINLGFEIEFKELKIGDYAVKDTIIERKTVQDFISSMINGRLLKQLEELKQFENKLLIIEGLSKQEIYSDENTGINANALRGFLLSIVLKHKIPIIFTKDSEDTAKFIDVLSRKKAKDVKLNAGKKMLNKKEQMQFIIEGFPGIGPKSSKELLKKFSTIQNIINAPKEDLEKILGKRAENFIEIISRRF
ncbi:hypothetical protein HYS72_02155 [Candidatus Pacearchaeota archaeon]|nr:hypothetical protein [Candidatus Pacearchaeota archaeon]